MRGQDAQIVHRVVAELDLVVMQGEGLLVDRIDGVDLAVQLDIGEGRLRVAADLPCESHVIGGDRRAIAPGGAGLDFISDRDALIAFGRGLQHRHAVLQRRQLCAEHADQFPIRIERGDRPVGHAQHHGFRHRRLDAGMQRGGELGDADGQRLVLRLKGWRRHECGKSGDGREWTSEMHGRASTESAPVADHRRNYRRLADAGRGVVNRAAEMAAIAIPGRPDTAAR